MHSLSNLIALVPAPPGAAIARADGEAEGIGLHDARPLFEGGDVLVAHAAFVAGRLGTRATVLLFDVLELFAFVRPGLPLVPSALGLARALGLAVPHTPEESAQTLHAIARALLDEVAGWPGEVRSSLAPLVATMERAGWRWAPLLKESVGSAPHGSPIAGLEAWRGLTQWEDEAPVGQPGSHAVEPAEARLRLARMVGMMRPEQASYSDAATYAFGPRQQAGAPLVALVEAGTGTGKTLGYLAPASLWKRTGRVFGSARTPATCSARSSRRSPICGPTRWSAPKRRWCARGGRIISACSILKKPPSAPRWRPASAPLHCG